MKKICIIGGGVTGLAAAVRLTELGGYDITVLEKEREVGGLARGLSRQDLKTDLGPHRINTELPEIERMIRDLAGDKLYTVKRKSQMFLKDRYVDYPIRPKQMVGALGPLLPARFMLSFAWHSVFGADNHVGSFESYMKRAFGPSLYEYLFRPYIEKTWKQKASTLSDEVARVRLSVGGLNQTLKELFGKKSQKTPGALKKFLYIRGGAVELANLLRDRAQAGGAKILTGAELSGFEAGENGITHVVYRQEGEARALPVDAAISTIPLPILLPPLLEFRRHQEAEQAAAKLKYLSILLVCLIVNRDRISDNNWLYFPGDDIIFNRAYEAKTFDENMGPKGKSLLCCEVTLPHEETNEQEKRERIMQRAAEDAARTGLFSQDEIDEIFDFYIEWAYPIYHVGFQKDLRRVWNYLSGFNNLLSVGRQGLFNHNNMDHSMAMGIAAANCIEENEVPGPMWFNSLDKFSKFRIVD